MSAESVKTEQPPQAASAPVAPSADFDWLETEEHGPTDPFGPKVVREAEERMRSVGTEMDATLNKSAAAAALSRSGTYPIEELLKARSAAVRQVTVEPEDLSEPDVEVVPELYSDFPISEETDI